MPNVLLTTRCNLSCKYCFAQEKLSSTRMHMPMENVHAVIDFLKRSEYPIFRVMGGEPTLHPQFIDIIKTALDEGLRVDVLSNATWSDEVAELFSRISPGILLFLLNIDHPENYSAKQWERIERNLSGLKGRGGVTLSFNIFEKEPRSDYILDIATRYGVRHIRLSLSLPVLGAENACLPVDELPEIAPFVMRFAAQAEALGISAQLDNAVPICIFSEEQIGKLILHGVFDLRRNTHCEPIIDIGPDLTIWSCFCLSQLANRKLSDFNDLAEAKEYFFRVWSVYQHTVFPMEKCYSCIYREKWGCQGGCLTYAIQTDQGERFQHAPAEPDQPEINPAYGLALADQVVLCRYELPKPTYLLRQTAAGVDFEIDDTLHAIVPYLDGKHPLAEIIGALQGPGNGSNRLRNFTQSILAESVPTLLAGLVRRGFLKQVDL